MSLSMNDSAQPPELDAGTAPESRVLTIGKLRFAIGTTWLSWAKSGVSATQAREWVSSQKDVLPAYEALIVLARADNRTDIGVCATYQPGLRALSQVVASHPEAFAPRLPSEVYRWGVMAEMAEGVYLAAASRDGLPLTDTLIERERVETAKARIDARFSDIHWVPLIGREEFEAKLAALAGAEPIAVRRVSRTKLRLLQAVLLAAVAVGAVVIVRHIQAIRAEQAALAAIAAAQASAVVPQGYQVQGALEGCLSAFQHTAAAASGWSLVEGACDTRNASFIWRRDPTGLATTAPAGAAVAADLRTATLEAPIRIGPCIMDQKARYARVEAAISDWAIAHGERWIAGGGAHPTISIEGIVPGWEMPIETCVRTVSLRWSQSGTWRLDIGW